MARYGVVETTKITEPCFDFKAVKAIENGNLYRRDACCNRRGLSRC